LGDKLCLSPNLLIQTNQRFVFIDSINDNIYNNEIIGSLGDKLCLSPNLLIQTNQRFVCIDSINDNIYNKGCSTKIKDFGSRTKPFGFSCSPLSYRIIIFIKSNNLINIISINNYYLIYYLYNWLYYSF